MMEQPNLIKRPILIRGSKVTFGFDKDKYESALKADITGGERRAWAISG